MKNTLKITLLLLVLSGLKTSAKTRVDTTYVYQKINSMSAQVVKKITTTTETITTEQVRSGTVKIPPEIAADSQAFDRMNAGSNLPIVKNLRIDWLHLNSVHDNYSWNNHQWVTERSKIMPIFMSIKSLHIVSIIMAFIGWFFYGLMRYEVPRKLEIELKFLFLMLFLSSIVSACFWVIGINSPSQNWIIFFILTAYNFLFTYLGRWIITPVFDPFTEKRKFATA